MNIRELLKEEDVNIQVVVNIKDLREFAHVLIEETMAKLSSKEEDVFLTAVEASEKLKVN